MCHQSVGLIARELERRGIPTLSMSSARSITEAVAPPRAVFLDFPLGHTAGRANDTQEQQSIMRDTLAAFSELREPGQIVALDYRWADNDDWKDRVMRRDPNKRASTHSDDRVERFPTPQYQTEADAAAAGGGTCPTCIWLE